MRFAIFGCGGFGREIVRLAQETGLDAPVFVADNPSGPVLGYPVLSPDRLTEGDQLVVALGSSSARKAVAERLHIPAGMLVSPTAVIGPDITIDLGAVICDFSTITASARIGAHFQCNIYSYVAHDCVIGDFVTFAPRVCCNGNVHIGDGAYIGTGAIIREGKAGKPLKIGAGATVGMGAVVTKDVPEGITVVGCPARPIG